MEFKVLFTDQKARVGELKLRSGVVETPVFMPVATRASLKTLDSDEILALNAPIVLANTYHLYLRPGLSVLTKAGGVQKFMNYPRPMLTDSGGFQVFSLSAKRKISEEGVRFYSHIDGQEIFLSPEEAIRAQNIISADIMMSFDECPMFPASHEYVKNSIERTIRWAKRGKEAHHNDSQALFGIVQGGIYPDLRKRCAEELVKMDFPGYSIGGVSVGENKDEMKKMIDYSIEYLPLDKPRYLMGVGSVDGILEGIERGVDMFDCVLPTRLARHGAALTTNGRVNIKAASHEFDFTPLDSSCCCPCCKKYSRAYLRHLFHVGEDTGKKLLTIHNITFLINLVNNARAAIKEGRFKEFKEDVYRSYKIDDSHPGF